MLRASGVSRFFGGFPDPPPALKFNLHSALDAYFWPPRDQSWLRPWSQSFIDCIHFHENVYVMISHWWLIEVIIDYNKIIIIIDTSRFVLIKDKNLNPCAQNSPTQNYTKESYF